MIGLTLFVGVVIANYMENKGARAFFSGMGGRVCRLHCLYRAGELSRGVAATRDTSRFHASRYGPADCGSEALARPDGSDPSGAAAAHPAPPRELAPPNLHV